VEIEHRRVLSEETLSETWEGRAAVAIETDLRPDGVGVTATAVDSGTRRVKATEEITFETRCARRAVGGIFEAPDSFFGVADDVWVSFAFLGMLLFSHSDSSDARVTAVLFALAVVPMAVDVVTFVPWWIAGHDWAGPCDFVSEVREEGVRTEERDESLERTVALSGVAVTVSQRVGKGLESRGRVTAGSDGKAVVRMKDLVAWSRGHGGDLVLEVADGGKRATALVSPGSVLNGPDGSPVDWSVGSPQAVPDLEAAAHVEGNTLVVRIVNHGRGDAWQVAAIVASGDLDVDGRVAAIGRVRAGETVEARIALPPGSTQGAVDFSEAWGRAPAALPY